MLRARLLLRQARSTAWLAVGRGEGCAAALPRAREPGSLQRPLALSFASAAEPPDGVKPPGGGPGTESEEDADGVQHKCSVAALSALALLVLHRSDQPDMKAAVAVVDEVAERQRWRQFAEQALDSTARAPPLTSQAPCAQAHALGRVFRIAAGSGRRGPAVQVVTLRRAGMLWRTARLTADLRERTLVRAAACGAAWGSRPWLRERTAATVPRPARRSAARRARRRLLLPRALQQEQRAQGLAARR